MINYKIEILLVLLTASNYFYSGFDIKNYNQIY